MRERIGTSDKIFNRQFRNLDGQFISNEVSRDELCSFGMDGRLSFDMSEHKQTGQSSVSERSNRPAQFTRPRTRSASIQAIALRRSVCISRPSSDGFVQSK